ncbi:hypothetical protein [Acaryochloris sp. IP29b_bin.137]|uniref:hypothetical protein n=1 Tax=Acaryochloris sp. IP29b_bin.137 TaxID=2969217 RepID=UPI0026052860|nr:hypothetical protein [Acaryochloris sp. IP29b_bin.137]
MTHIPTLTHQQLELLRLAKKHSVKELQLSYEFPVIDSSEPPMGHPPFIQELIDDHLVQVQVKGTSLNASEFQQESWTKFCSGIEHPTQADWNQWRQGFIAQLKEGFEYLMTPGNGFEQFSQVWRREIRLRAIQPGNP